MSLREMGDYKTTRLLVCCALYRIWSSTQRLEDLDWFGPEMPYIQYGGWCSRSIALEPGCSKFRGELTSWSSSAGSLGVQPFPTWGAFPFIVQGGAPITGIKCYVLAPSGCDSSLSVVGAHSVSREWAGLILAIFWARDDPGDPLGRRVPPVLSHLGSVGTARPLGWSLGGLLRSCPPKPMFLVREAIPRLPCVALVSRTASW